MYRLVIADDEDIIVWASSDCPEIDGVSCPEVAVSVDHQELLGLSLWA